MEIEKKHEDLEGRVIVYSTFIPLKNDENKDNLDKMGIYPGKIFALYATTDLLDFAAKIGMPEETTEKIQKEIEGHIDDVSTFIAIKNKNASLKEELKKDFFHYLLLLCLTLIKLLCLLLKKT